MPPLSCANFDFVRDLVRQQSAVVLGSEKGYLVETRLSPLAAREGFHSVDEFVAHLRRAPESPLSERVVDAMTTNETSFFRDIEPFEILRKRVIPEMIERRDARRALTIWSAACSSGQEPYSIALSLAEHFPQLRHWDVEIMATDLSTDMLDRARPGRYSQLEVNRGLPAPLLVKHFHKVGIEWQINANTRSRVRFGQFNLVSGAWAMIPRVDVIFLRNVLIYFDVPTRQAVLDNVRRVLRPDGYLFLGETETTAKLDSAFEHVPLERSACYRLRREEPSPGSRATGVAAPKCPLK